MEMAGPTSSSLLLDIPWTAFAALFAELGEDEVAALRRVCQHLRALIDACVQAIDTTHLGEYLKLRFTRLERLATSLRFRLPDVDAEDCMDLSSAPCLSFPSLHAFLPTTITSLSLDCILAGMDYACLAALTGLKQLCLRQFPAHHASSLQQVGACSELLRLRLDSRHAARGLREMQTEALAHLAPLRKLRSLDLLCTLFVGPNRTLPADLTDAHFSAIAQHLTLLTHLGLMNEALDETWGTEADENAHLDDESAALKCYLGCKFAWLASLPFLASLHLMGIQKVPKVLQRLQQAAEQAAQRGGAGFATEADLQEVAAESSSVALPLLGDDQPGAWHHPGSHSAAWRAPQQHQQQGVGLRSLRLELVYSCGNRSIARIAANSRLEVLSLLFSQFTYHSAALQPLAQLRCLKALNIGYEHLEELADGKVPALPPMGSALSSLMVAQPLLHVSWLSCLQGCPGLVHLLLDCNDIKGRREEPAAAVSSSLRTALRSLASLHMLDVPNADWTSETMLREVVPRCSSLRELELLVEPGMSANPVAAVEGLAQLRKLSLLSSGSIPQAASDQIGRLTALRNLSQLSLLHDTGAGTEPHLPLPGSITLLSQLRMLELDSLAAADFGQLRGLAQLRVLLLKRAKVTSLGGDATLMEQLAGCSAQPLPLLRYLALHAAHVTEPGAALLRRFRSLRYLTLYECTGVKSGHLAQLGRLRGLRALSLVMPDRSASLVGRGSGEPALVQLVRGLPGLQLLNVVAKGVGRSQLEEAGAALQQQLLVSESRDKDLLWPCAERVLARGAAGGQQWGQL